MLIIRPYHPQDWQRLCAIHDASRLNELSFSVGVGAFLTLEATFDNEGLFDGKVIVAEHDEDVRGFAAYNHQELTWLYVDPPFYRKGVGRALIREVLADMSGAVQVEVLEGNRPALRLYLSEGFQIVSRRDGKLVGNEAHDASGLVLRRERSRCDADLLRNVR